MNHLPYPSLRASSSPSSSDACDLCAFLAWVRLLSCLVALLAFTGCNLVPDVRHKPQYHNPFPQLQRVAVLPFTNQSEDPTLSGMRVATAYSSELQAIPGFEVMPLGVIENLLSAFERNELQREIQSKEDFQHFARFAGLDAVLTGAITDYDSYYPPRMTIMVNWYAANPALHPIPVGYGLPWGTKAEKKIPQWIRLETERGIAREQIATQAPITPELLPEQQEALRHSSSDEMASDTPIEDARIRIPSESDPKEESIQADDQVEPAMGRRSQIATDLPPTWPDPQGLIPKPPQPVRPIAMVQTDPVISYMKAYNGNDEDFTEALADYFYFRDDARFGGWQAYLQRSEDFIRFCCHQHVIETLGSRGGQLKSRMILRWPIDRYDR